MKPSQRQQDIFDFWDNQESNMLINAVAGSGKTTTILELVKRCKHRTLFLAFNKFIQEEINQKLQYQNLKQGKAMTLHSLGLSAIKAKYKFKIEKNKNYKLTSLVEKKNKSFFNRLSWGDKWRILYSLSDINDISRLFMTNDLVKIQEYLISMDKDVSIGGRIPELWKDLLEFREREYSNYVMEIDFIDMIYVPVYKKLDIPVKPYYMMIDEAQDLNLCQHLLIDKLIKGTVRRWVAVGDRKQAIYGFSGASSNSFDLFLEKDNVVEMPLDLCYRCSSKIVDEANKVYPVMDAFKEDEGTVEAISNLTTIENNSMIICRNSGPLIKVFFELISLGKPAFIKGEDILGSIKRFLAPYKFKSVRAARREMEIKIVEMSSEKEETYKLFKFKENYANFNLIVSNFDAEGSVVEGILKKIHQIFENKHNAITLCTIHKSKGLESNTVYILNENLIPSKFAVSNSQLAQEKNLKYVARTRAKEKLFYLNY